MALPPVTKEEINDDARYVVQTPNQKYMVNSEGNTLIRGEDVKKLPHWNHCTTAFDNMLVKFIYKRPPSTRFSFGGAVGMDAIASIRAIDTNLTTYRTRIRQNEEAAANAITEREQMRQRYVSGFKPSTEHKHEREVIRGRLLDNDDILDVRFEGEVIDLSRINHTGMFGTNDGVVGEYEVPASSMLVMFVGAIMRNAGGFVPLPPMSFVFGGNGSVHGGPLSIHPHTKPRDICQGTAHELFMGAAQAHDVYAAVDIARHFRFGHNDRSELNHSWRVAAWNWWIANENKGWPTIEPFQKPWLETKLIAEQGLVPLEKLLGTDGHEQMMTALHLGQQNGVYMSTYKKVLNTKTYGVLNGSTSAQGQLPCGCGLMLDEPSPEVRQDWVQCTCHQPNSRGVVYSSQPCPRCGESASVCPCVWPHRMSWRSLNTSDYVCEAHCGDMGAGPERQMKYQYRYDSSNPAAQAYRGPRIICEECLPPNIITDGLWEDTSGSAVCLRCQNRLDQHWGEKCQNRITSLWFTSRLMFIAKKDGEPEENEAAIVGADGLVRGGRDETIGQRMSRIISESPTGRLNTPPLEESMEAIREFNNTTMPQAGPAVLTETNLQRIMREIAEDAGVIARAEVDGEPDEVMAYVEEDLFDTDDEGGVDVEDLPID